MKRLTFKYPFNTLSPKSDISHLNDYSAPKFTCF